MTKITLYGNDLSPPTRLVRMVATALGVEYEVKRTYPPNGDCMTPEYLKINPMHTVPTIIDDGFILSESNAIAIYLIEKYAKDDVLYPKDLQKRALVNERLFYNATIFGRALVIIRVEFYLGEKAPDGDWERLIDSLETVERFLQTHKWIAGDSLTVADYAYLTSIACVIVVIKGRKLEISKYPNIKRWFADAEASIPNAKKYQELFEKAIQTYKEGGKY